MTEIQHVHQLLELNDTKFIDAVYLTLLGREPDAEGLRHYLHHLRSGHGKISMLKEVAASSEARTFGKDLPGLRETIEERDGLTRFIRGGRNREQRIQRQLNQIENELGRATQKLRDFELQTAERMKGFEEAIHALRKTVQRWIESGDDAGAQREPESAASSEQAVPIRNEASDFSTLPAVAKQIFKDLADAISEVNEDHSSSP